MSRPGLAFALVLALLAAACSGSGQTPPTLASGTTTSTTTTSSTTVTTATAPPTTDGVTTSSSTTSSTTTAAPGPTIPIPDLDADSDPEVVWRELIEYHNWAFQNPEQADLSLYVSEECVCFSNLQATLDEYVANGWREISPGYTVHDVRVGIATSTAALMTVVDEHSALVVVDAEGNIVREEERRPKTFFDVRIRLFDDGWRIVESLRRGEIGDAE